jgi:hypothetical protein
VLESADNANAWDGGHRRPRSLSRVGDWWYLYFEGAAEDERETTNTTCFRDAVGLARSRDLITWDTAHPYRVALAPSPDPDTDAIWTGWPRAAETSAGDGEALHLFFSVGGNDFIDQGTHHYASVASQDVPLDDLACCWD